MSRIRAVLTGLSAGRLMTVLAAAIVAVAVAAPLAIGAGEGSTLKGGARNPAGGHSFSAETQVIAVNSTFGTRQSNKGSGGGAIYGCRAQNTGKGCIEASNLSNGQAFNFRFRGPIGGTISTNATGTAAAAAKPFVTNATGVATGLNADRVDDMDASQIVDKAVAGAQAAAQGATKIAIVAADGTLQTHRGITASSKSGTGTYVVTTDADVSKCVPTATAYGASPGANVAVEPVDATHLRIHTQDSTGTAADRQVAVTINC